MDKDYLARRNQSYRTGKVVDLAFKRRCIGMGLNPDRPEKSLAAMAEAEAVKLPPHRSGILAPIRPWPPR
jgi:hypothetical protein